MAVSEHDRRCAICGGRLGRQCFGGVWSNDWNDYMEGKIPPSQIRESCPYCYATGEPPYMYGEAAHDAIIEIRRRMCEAQSSK